MIEALTLIANAQAQLGNLHLTLIANQETPRSLEKAARMARSLEETSDALKRHLREWSESLRDQIAADELIASIPYQNQDE